MFFAAATAQIPSRGRNGGYMSRCLNPCPPIYTLSLYRRRKIQIRAGHSATRISPTTRHLLPLAWPLSGGVCRDLIQDAASCIPSASGCKLPATVYLPNQR